MPLFYCLKANFLPKKCSHLFRWSCIMSSLFTAVVPWHRLCRCCLVLINSLAQSLFVLRAAIFLILHIMT